MSKQRIVKDSFWTDPYIEDLNPIEKLLFLYMLTNPLCNVLGIYELRIKRISYDTGIEEDLIEKILERFVVDGKLVRIEDWLIIINFAKNQSKNPSVIKGIQRIFDKLPDKVRQAVTASPPLATYLTLLNLTLLNVEKNSTSKKSNFEMCDIEMSKRLLTKILNNTPTFKEPNIEMWAGHIRLMRTIDNRTQEQIEYVIDWCQKSTFWQANILSTSKLRKQFDTLVAQIKRDSNKESSKVVF